ncbi:MAG: hypothetical protein M1827_002523 [Pycnora praestabilis]|nr:MAG: hypothetical protein M1827_002523 [Pycnora praestabilis]
MDSNGDGYLQRTSSHASTISTKSRNSDTVRIKPRKHTSASSLAATPSDKSLTSFPSLSPETSPSILRNGTPRKAVPPQAQSQTPRKPSVHAPSIVESLTTASPPLGNRSALFDDSPLNSRDVPGTIHHASDEHIERLIARSGAVDLVRQLAEDLAQRDAQITVLRRRAEEREMILRKMLRECEVSNLDIETRLHSLDTAHGQRVIDNKGRERANTDRGKKSTAKRSVSVTDSIDEMVNEAMSETLGMEPETDAVFLGVAVMEEPDHHATLRASHLSHAHEEDGRSIDSNQGYRRNEKGTVKGWKDLLWTGPTTSRKSSRASSIISELNEDAEAAARSKAASGVTSRRKGLSQDLFRPTDRGSLHNPTQKGSIRAGAGDGNDSDANSLKSATSVASWAIKLVAGNPQAGREVDPKRTVRGRAATTGEGLARNPRTDSLASTKTTTSARAALTRVQSTHSTAQSLRHSTSSANAGASGTVKINPHEGWRSVASSILPQGSPPETDDASSASNLGPVEMDTILPPDTRPPTLTQTYNDYHPTEFLTDRFGFIYDQRRKMRQNEAATVVRKGKRLSGMEMLSTTRDETDTSSDEDETEFGNLERSPSQSSQRPETPTSVEGVDGKPTKRWQDYLKIATFPAELLSHTPSSGAITTLKSTEADTTSKPSQITIDSRGSLPALSLNPEPSASPIVSDVAELAQPSISGSSTPITPVKQQPEPVKLLLEQLTEVHDSLQREKTVKWNKFLQKVRAERRRDGGHMTLAEGRQKGASMPEVSLTDGEMIGVAGLGNKGKVGRAKWNEFKHLVLGGIPVGYRAKIWAECSGAAALKIPGYYEDLVNSDIDDPVAVAQIKLDINRTMTDNIFFRKGPGVAKLNEVLLAYSRRNPEVGYCQGMNLITGCLLLIMPTAEDAFWVLTSMIENILPQNYYDNSLLVSRADQQVLRQYVAEILPKLSAHLDDLGIELEALTFQWFLSVFTDCLSAEALFRVWDVVLCTNDGSTFLFQLALALLKLNEGSLMEFDSPADVHGYINHQMTNHAISIDGLIHASEALGKVVKRDDVENRRAVAVDAEKEIVRQRELLRTGKWEKRHGAMEDEERHAEQTTASYNDLNGSEVGESPSVLKLQDPMPMDEEVDVR